MNLPGRIWNTVNQLIFNTPKTAGEALWRVLSVASVSGIMISSWMLYKYPDLIENFLQGQSEVEIAQIFRRKPRIRDQVMELLARYIAVYRPTQIGLVSWISQTGIEHIWSNEGTETWPTATSGTMSLNMREATGYMIFDQCWVGEMPSTGYGSSHNDGTDWLICGGGSS